MIFLYTPSTQWFLWLWWFLWLFIFMHFDIILCLQLLYLFCKTLVNCHAYNESECVMPSWHSWQKTTSPDQQNQLYWSIPDSFTVSRQQPELNYCELVVLLPHRHLLDISDPCLCNNNDLSCNWTCNCAKPQSYLNNSMLWMAISALLSLERCF